jgi:glyoxylase-like metal-dependent hydrolase (beta-lactamase superfamily II)
MNATSVLELGKGRRMIDLDFRDTEGLVAAYLLPQEGGWTLVETGPTTCRESLLRGLGDAGVEPHEVRRVFVTHIHLDHAGGVGALADALPNATFYAHELGVPHLIDPARLIASARRVWGAETDPLWGPIVPLASGRVVGLRGGESFPLAGGALRAIATPGHARHHLAFFDSAIGAVFTGDGAGVRLEDSWRARPAIPPPDLDLDQLYSSVEEMRRLEPRLVLYSHFGPAPGGAQELADYRSIVEEWRRVALDAARERPEAEFVAGRLREHELARRTAAGRSTDAAEHSDLVSGYALAAQGLLRYFEVHGDIGRRGV